MPAPRRPKADAKAISWGVVDQIITALGLEFAVSSRESAGLMDWSRRYAADESSTTVSVITALKSHVRYHFNAMEKPSSGYTEFRGSLVQRILADDLLPGAVAELLNAEGLTEACHAELAQFAESPEAWDRDPDPLQWCTRCKSCQMPEHRCLQKITTVHELIHADL